MPSFIFNISSNVWNSQNNTPKKYPINNIQDSFVDLSFNEISIYDMSNNHITQVSISWSNFIDKGTNDGLSFNSYTVPYYNEPSLNIIQFGNIPLSRNSANNSNFWQFYKFAGKISASDKPYILSNTTLYNAFANSSCNTYNNLALWDISGVTDVRNMFSWATKFNQRIGLWNYRNIAQKQVQNMIYNTGYNAVKMSIFLQDLSSNITFPNDVSLGQIGPYLNNPKTVYAVNALRNRKIFFDCSSIISEPKTFKTFGYSTSDLRIAGYLPPDLSGAIYTLSEYKLGNYTIAELNTFNRYSISQYKNVGYSLSEFISSGYTARSLRSLNYTATNYKTAEYYGYDLSTSFSLSDLLNAGYSLNFLREIGYTISQIKNINSTYNVLNYKKAGYSLTDISNAGFPLSDFQNYSVSVLKENNVFASDFKGVGYTINSILNLGYGLQDLRDATYTIPQIKQFTQYTDLDYSSVGYSLTDISNGGFPIIHLSTYLPLPNILKQNSIYAYEFKQIGYDISSIVYTFGYKAADLKDASYSVLQMKNVGISANDLKPLGYSASELRGVGFTSLDLRNATYTLQQIQSAGYSIANLRSAGYTPVDISNSYSIRQMYDGSYTVLEFVNSGYTPQQINAQLSKPNGPLDPLPLVSFMIRQYPPYVMKTSYITLSAFYAPNILNTSLSIIQQADFPSWEIKSINSNVNLYNGAIIGGANPLISNNNVTLNDLSNAGFNVSQLIAKIMYLKSDINIALSKYRRFIPYPVFKQSEFVYINNSNAVEYKYSTIMPFEYAEPSFNSIGGTYSSLINGTTNYVGSISIPDNSFGFYDVSLNVFQQYNTVKISTNGWLSFSLNSTTVNVVRFFPYNTRNSSIKYTFWTNSENIKILEIQLNGDVSGNPVLMTAHIHQDGLMTFCNGYYNSNLFVPGNTLYSNPDPSMVLLTPGIPYYCAPMGNYYDASTNSIKSTIYDVLRIDLRSDITKCGYLVKELVGTYSLSKINSEGSIGTVNNLRNIGYSVGTLKQNNFPVFDIVSVYNINIGILDILFYT